MELPPWRTTSKATEDKNKAIAQADKTASKKALADRLINGLSGERVRWGEALRSSMRWKES